MATTSRADCAVASRASGIDASARQASRARAIALCMGLFGICGCGSSSRQSAATPACTGQACADGIALFAVRQAMKLVYNEALVGAAPDAQDAGAECLTGSATVTGAARPDGDAGAVQVDLTYTFARCELLWKDTTLHRDCDVVLEGALSETGTLAVQSTSTTALAVTSDAFSIHGTVDDPPVSYDAPACALSFAQAGGQLSGTICGRAAVFTY